MNVLKLFIAISVIMTAVTHAYAEYVFLKTGEILNCKIETEAANTMTVRLAEGKQLKLARTNIMRILYTELYMGKIFVNRIDGTTIEAYMVDEDQKSYTFRKELYNPQEFTLKREEVLFTARKNPVGLQGTAETDSVNIKWNPPYTPVKNYKIYFRSGNDSYKVYGESGSTKAYLKGLKSNVLYYVKVTAIDKEGYESLPSNEIKIMTLNVLPDAPVRVRTERKVSEDGAEMTASISWDPAVDTDGKIKGYRIYRKEKKDFRLLGMTENTTFSVNKLNPDSNYYFAVTSVDNKDGESYKSRLSNTLGLYGYDLIIYGNYIKPLGSFSELHSNGIGALVSFFKDDILFDNVNIGISTGFTKYTGESSDIISSISVPFQLELAYRIEFHQAFSVSPKISGGYSYNRVTYKSEAIEKKISSFEPIIAAGIITELNITNIWHLNLGVDYGIIMEEPKLMTFIAVKCGVGIKI